MGCRGLQRDRKHLANRLLADGEQVVDVPPKLSARTRMFATGQGRKTDETDAHSVALVGTRMSGLRPVVDDEQLAVLRILVDRRRSLGEDHTRMVSQLHQLLLELIPGGAKRYLSAAQAKALLGKVRPRDAAGKTRRRVAAELIGDLERIYARRKAADKELNALLEATGTTLTSCTASDPPVPPGYSSKSVTSPASPPGRTSPPGPAPPPSTHPPVTTCGTGSPAAGTGRSTACCTSWPPCNYATPPKDAPTTTGRKPPGKPRWKPCAASNADCPTSSTGNCARRSDQVGRAREDTRGRLLTPARPTQTPTSTLRRSHFPDPSPRRYAHPKHRPFFGPFPTPCHSAGPQPSSSAVCLTTARTGAPSTGGNNTLLTQRGTGGCVAPDW